MTPRVAILDIRPERRGLLRARVGEALAALGPPWSSAAVDAYEEADELERAGGFQLLLIHKGHDQAGALDVAERALAHGGSVVFYGGIGLARDAIPLRGSLHVESSEIATETVSAWALEDILRRLLAIAAVPSIDAEGRRRLVRPSRRLRASAARPAIDAKNRRRLVELGDPPVVCPGEDLADRVLELRGGGYFGPIVVLHNDRRPSLEPLVAQWLKDPSIVASSMHSIPDAVAQLAALDPIHREPVATAHRCLVAAARLLLNRAQDTDSHDLCGRTAPLRVAATPGPLGLGSLELFDAVRERIRSAVSLSAIEAVLVAAWRMLVASVASSPIPPVPLAEPLEVWLVDDHADAGWTALLEACWPGARIRGLTSTAAVDQALAAGGVPDVAIVDLYLDPLRDEEQHRIDQLDGISGVRVRQRLHDAQPQLPIYLLTASNQFDALDAARGGSSPPVGILQKLPLWAGPFPRDAGSPAKLSAFTTMLATLHRWASLVAEIRWLSAPPARLRPWWCKELTDAGTGLADLAARLLITAPGTLPRFDETLVTVAALFTEWCAFKKDHKALKNAHPGDLTRIYLPFLFWRTLRNALAHYGSVEALSMEDRFRLVFVCTRMSELLWDDRGPSTPIPLHEALDCAGLQYRQRLGAGIARVHASDPFIACAFLTGRVAAEWPALPMGVSQQSWNVFCAAILDPMPLPAPPAPPFAFLELLLGCWLHVAALSGIALPDRTRTAVVAALSVWQGR